MKCYLVYEVLQRWANTGVCLSEQKSKQLYKTAYDVVVLGIFDSAEKAGEFRKHLREEDDKYPVDEGYEEYSSGIVSRSTIELEMNTEFKKFLMTEKFTEVI